jgi:hypothetical protein
MTEQTKEKHQGWVASLSNGETVFQHSVPAGEQSAWSQLRARCDEEGLHVTQIQLQRYGNTLVGLPNADGYSAFYEYQHAWFSGKTAEYQGIGSVLGDWVLCIFTNESKNIWQDLRPLADMSKHCQLKPAEALRKLRPRPVMADSPYARKQIEKEIVHDWNKEFDVVLDWFTLNARILKGMDDERMLAKIQEDTGVELNPEQLAMFRKHTID